MEDEYRKRTAKTPVLIKALAFLVPIKIANLMLHVFALDCKLSKNVA